LNALPRDAPLAILQANSCLGITEIDTVLPSTSLLSDLSLRTCSNLRSVTLIAPTLSHLRVSGCAQLCRFALRAPNLTSLQAVHCGKLSALEVRGLLEDGDRGLENTCLAALEKVDLAGCYALPGTQVATLLKSCRALARCNLTGCLGIGSLTVPGVDNILSWRSARHYEMSILIAFSHPKRGLVVM
jgi:hypothetical protein